jgi:hypothetical protein
MFACLLGGLYPASAVGARLTICVEDPVRDRPAAAHLQRSLGTTRLHLARKSKRNGKCDGWFEQRGQRVVFVLQGRRARLARTIPWLAKARFGLSRLAAHNRLSSFSVLLLALLAEQRLGPLSVKKERRGRRRPPRQPLPPPAVEEEPKAEPEAAPTSQPATQPTESKPGPRAPESQPVIVRRAPRPRALPKTKPRPAPRRSWLRTELVDQLGASLQLGSALRTGETMLTPLEVGAGLRWRSVVVEARYQAPSDWSLEGRDIRVQAVSLAAGWAPRLWTGGRFGLNGQLSVLGERVFLRRTGLERTEARDHTFWDLGAMAGFTLDIRLSGGFSTGVGLQGVFFPASHEVRIPLGPGARLNVFSVRLGLRVAWGGPGNPAGKFL